MEEQQFFSLVAGLALLVWLLGRHILPDPRRRRQAELFALGLVVAAILYALFRALQEFLA
jgi:hypothetical protein